jgi:hypothetical protein
VFLLRPRADRPDILGRGKFILSSLFERNVRARLQVSRAMRELGRYALGKIDHNRRTIQVHRLIQKVIADGLTEDEGTMIRSAYHQALELDRQILAERRNLSSQPRPA